VFVITQVTISINAGVAQRSLERFDESKKDLKHALVLEPTNKAVKQELETTDREEMTKKKKKAGVNDYSRFDNLDISDDEEEEKPNPQQPAPPVKSNKASPPKKAVSRPTKPATEEEDEEDLGLPNKVKKSGNSKYWWDQSGGKTSTGIITPQKIESSPEKPVATASQPGSVWNNAGTWEEKEMLKYWKESLPETLVGLETPWEDGCVKVSALSEVDGEATICVRRGKISRLFDLNFSVSFIAMGQGKTYKGKIKLPNVAEDHEDEFEMTLKWEGTKPKSGGILEGSLLTALDTRKKSNGSLGYQITQGILSAISGYNQLS